MSTPDFKVQLTDYLRDLHLPAVRRCFEEKARHAEGETLSYERYLFELIELECQDVKKTLLQLIPLLAEEGVELTGLETEEPNLERVFLHLTGRGLRD